MFLNNKELVLMKLFVHRKLACLFKGLCAVNKWALKGPLSSMDVGVLLKILAKCKLLVTDYAREHF